MTGILLLGKYGQLGWELHRSLAPFGGLTALDYPEIDLVNPNGLDEIIQDLKPGVIINATAYTAVDKAEDEVDQQISDQCRHSRPAAFRVRLSHCCTTAIFVLISNDYQTITYLIQRIDPSLKLSLLRGPREHNAQGVHGCCNPAKIKPLICILLYMGAYLKTVSIPCQP